MPDINLVDLFSGDAFSVLKLSTAIQMVPNQYGRVNELNIFGQSSVDTSMVAIEIEQGVLNLIPSTERNSAAPKNKTSKRNIKPFLVPRLALDDMIYPSDIQNVRAFGENTLKTPQAEVNKRLMELSRKHDITHEYLKCGALAGIIKDADGSTIFNLFEEFDITEKSVNFALANEATNVASKCEEITGHIEDNIMGDMVAYVHALCSPGFFSLLTEHPKVREAYENYLAMSETSLAVRGGPSANPLRDSVRKGFVFKGIHFEEYRGNAPYLNDKGKPVSRKFIADNTARFFPIGTSQTFFNYNAPADWMETVNTLGLPKYAKVVPEQGGRFVEVLSQSCHLPLCLRPAVLVKGTTA